MLNEDHLWTLVWTTAGNVLPALHTHAEKETQRHTEQHIMGRKSSCHDQEILLSPLYNTQADSTIHDPSMAQKPIQEKARPGFPRPKDSHGLAARVSRTQPP